MKKLIIIVLVGCLAIAAVSIPLLLRSDNDNMQAKWSEIFHVNLPQYLAEDSPELEIVSNSTYNPLDEDIMIYKVLSPHVTAQYAMSIGSKLGFAGSAGPVDSSSIGMIDEQGDTVKTLRVFTNSGGIEYMLPDEWFPVVESQPLLPSHEEAKNMAMDFLKQADLLPGDYSHIEVIEGSSQIKGLTTDGSSSLEEEKYVVELHILISREIDGKPVIGPGQKLKVFIGENGITGAMILWREIEPYRKLPLKSVEEALTDLQQGKYSTYYAPKGSNKALITDISLGYWMSPAPEYQEYAVPIYEMKGVCLDQDGKETGSFTGWCEAIQSSYQ